MAKVRILLVDDHAIMRDAVAGMLATHEGTEVVGVASTGREAVESVARLMPDVVVMDIAMPDLNGVEATRKIVASDPKIKVIALSAHTDRQFVLAILEAG